MVGFLSEATLSAGGITVSPKPAVGFEAREDRGLVLSVC